MLLFNTEKEAIVPDYGDALFHEAVKAVRKARKREQDIARAEHREERKFKQIMGEAVESLGVSSRERDELLHVLAPWFGGHGGSKKPRKKAVRKARKNKFGMRPIVLTPAQQLDMLNTRREANEHICPLH